MKKKLSLILAMIMAASVLMSTVACSKNASSDDEEIEEKEDEEEKEEKETDEETSVADITAAEETTAPEETTAEYSAPETTRRAEDVTEEIVFDTADVTEDTLPTYEGTVESTAVPTDPTVTSPETDEITEETTGIADTDEPSLPVITPDAPVDTTAEITEETTPDIAEPETPSVSDITSTLGNTKVLTDALKAYDSLAYRDLELDGSVSYSLYGISASMPITGYRKYIFADPESPITDEVMSISLMGIESLSRTYHEAGWTYISNNGVNYKVEQDIVPNLFVGMYNDSTTLIGIAALFANKQFTDNGDGTRSISAEIPAEAMDIAVAMISEDMEISSMTLTYTLKGNDIHSIGLEFSVAMEYSGIAMDMSYNLVHTLVNPNVPFTVTPPEGYKDYPDFAITDNNMSGLGDIDAVA